MPKTNKVFMAKHKCPECKKRMESMAELAKHKESCMSKHKDTEMTGHK